MSKSRINQLTLTSSFTKTLSILDECIRQERALIDLEAKGSHVQVIEGTINEINLLNFIKTQSQRLPMLLNQDQTLSIERCILREKLSLLETELRRRQETRSQNSNITQRNEEKNAASNGDFSLNLRSCFDSLDPVEQLQESKQESSYLNPSPGSITTNSVFVHNKQPTPVAAQAPMPSAIAPHVKPEIDDAASLPPLKQLKKG